MHFIMLLSILFDSFATIPESSSIIGPNGVPVLGEALIKQNEYAGHVIIWGRVKTPVMTTEPSV